MTTLRALDTLVVSALLAALAGPTDDVSFHPSPVSRLAKELKVSLEIRPEKMDVTVNGEPTSSEDLGSLAQPARIDLGVAVTETYVESRRGRPIDLLRAYERISLAARDGDGSEETADFDELRGKTVRFRWDDETETYERAYHECEGDPLHLVDLSDDMDLRVLLPARDVSEGNRWEVEGSELLPLFVPGGLPGTLAPESAGEALRSALEDAQKELARIVSGARVRCEYRGSRDEAGVRVGEIRFEFDCRGDSDLSGTVERLTEEDEIHPTADASASVGVEGTGTLLWDLGAGHVRSFAMQVDTDVGLVVRASADVEGDPFELTIDGRVTARGTWSLATSTP